MELKKIVYIVTTNENNETLYLTKHDGFLSLQQLLAYKSPNEPWRVPFELASKSSAIRFYQHKCRLNPEFAKQYPLSTITVKEITYISQLPT